ncbi:MAG TPA: ABC transporter permease [Candidatus Acidoferrales bacterium]|nr:ABC transporter permease [Candidatus Acidoferrales bacterium]
MNRFGGGKVGSFWQDLQHGARLLAKKPGFTAVAVITLALGIGGSTAIFSVVYGVVLRPLPYPHPDQIVRVFEVTESGNHIRFSDPDLSDVRDQARSLSGLAEFNSDLEPVLGNVEPTLATVTAVSRDFFDVMGVHPLLGRGFASSDLHEGGAPAALVSYGFWRRSLGGAPDFQAKHLSLEGHLCAVVGVMPPGFDFPDQTQIWMPREIFPMDPYRTGHNWSAIGRIRNGTTLAAAQAEATGIARRLKQQYGNQSNMSDTALVPLAEQMVGGTRPALLMLLGAVGLLLLVACANVANLLLAQAAERQRELAVRVALGASPRRLAGQFVAETLALSVAGTLAGLPVAIWGVRVLLALEPGKLPRAEGVGVQLPVLGFAAALAVATAVALGLVVALRAAGRDVQESLKEGARTQSGGASSHRIRLALMGAQVAVTLVLLVGAGLLARSLLRLLAVDPGFLTQNILTMDLLDVWPETDAARARLVRTLDQLTGRLAAVPGIRHAGVISVLPLTGLGGDGTYLVLNGTEKFASLDQLARMMPTLSQDPAHSGHAEYRVAGEGYFPALGIPLLRGRLFNEGDGPDTLQVAVVSQSFAARQWRGEDPLGKIVEFGNMDADTRPFTIVGVVGDVHDQSLDSAVDPILYSDYRQRRANDFSVVMQTTRPAAELVPLARAIEREIEPDLPVRFGSVRQLVSASIGDRRFSALLLGIFAVAALVVALLGVYGVGSFLVAQRTKEIGIRLAIGAEAGDVVWMVATQGLRVIAAGVAVGVAGAFALTRLLANLLYGVTPVDPLTFLAVIAVVVAAGLAACYIPARRAARVDPLTALREQ